MPLDESTPMPPPPFLATTALEAFWDTSGRVLFLGDWCRIYSRKGSWSALNGEIIASPWESLEDVEASFIQASDIYEELLPQLARGLNELHGTGYSLRYWRIVAGPWLLFYVHSMLDRFLRIRKALALFPDLTSIALSKRSFILSRDTMDFVDLCKGDLFNLQMYSRIFSFMGKTFPTKEAAPAEKTPPLSKERLTPGLFLLKSANFALKKISNAIKDRPGVLLKSSYFSPYQELKLFIKTAGKIRLVDRKPLRTSARSAQVILRERLPDFLPDGDEFHRFLKEVLSDDMPQAFLEGFAELRAEAAHYPTNPTAIFTSNAYFYDEAFKVWAAECTEKGVLLLGSQHGGNYGVSSRLQLFNHEVTICDRYYTWGWEEPNCFAKVVPLTAAKLAGRPEIGADNRKDRILLASTASFRYLTQFPFLPEYFEAYLAWQQRFASALSSDVRPALRIRLLAENLGWDMKQRWLDRFPEVTLEREGANANFFQSLAKCRLFVSDHISTTYIEALSANKPVVMFFNREIFPVRPEAQKYLDLLRKGGILYDTPEAAAATVMAVYPDVESWWNDPGRQACRAQFCEKYGRNRADGLDVWNREFLDVLRTPSLNRETQGKP